MRTDYGQLMACFQRWTTARTLSRSQTTNTRYNLPTFGPAISNLLRHFNPFTEDPLYALSTTFVSFSSSCARRLDCLLVRLNPIRLGILSKNILVGEKIFVVDQVVWCNHTAEKILGYGREHMIGQDIRDFQTTGAGDSISAKVEITDTFMVGI